MAAAKCFAKGKVPFFSKIFHAFSILYDSVLFTEVDPLGKAELRGDIASKKKMQDLLQNMFVELDSAANTVRTDYLSASHQTPLRKDEDMKRLVKRITMADNLKPSRFSF